MTAEISVIKVKGYLDSITSEELDTAIEELLNAKRYNIIIDLADVDYISSMGWGVFLSRINDVRSRDGDLKLACMQENIYEVFKVLEFELFLKVYPCIASAAASFHPNTNGISQQMAASVHPNGH